jgi:hypothetical protein
MTIETLECIPQRIDALQGYIERKSELGELLKRANTGIQAAFRIRSLLYAIEYHIVHI